MENKKHRLLRYLNNAHATEIAGAGGLKDLIARTSDPAVLAVASEHLTQTRDQAKRLAARIKTLGGKVAKSKVAEQRTAGKATLLLNALHDHEDKQTQELVKSYALEHFEIGAYTSLIAYAQAIGDTQTADLAETIRAEEVRAAERMGALIAPVAAQAVAQTPFSASAAAAAAGLNQAAPAPVSMTTAGKKRRGGVPLWLLVAGGTTAAVLLAARRTSDKDITSSESDVFMPSANGVSTGDNVRSTTAAARTYETPAAASTTSATVGSTIVQHPSLGETTPPPPFAAPSPGPLPVAESHYGAGLSAHENAAVPATGRDEEHDPLGGSAHGLPAEQAKYIRAAERHVQGKNTAPEREALYDKLEEDGVGESGEQGHPTGQDDRNPIGPRK